jgi:HK97 family phage portal protein
MGIVKDLISAVKDYRESASPGSGKDYTLLSRQDIHSKGLPFQGQGYSGYSGEFISVAGDPLDAIIRKYKNSNVDYMRELGDPMQSSLVASAVQWFGTVLPEAPIGVREGKKGQERQVDHELSRLIETPNPYYSGETLLMAFALSWIVSGNVFWIKSRNARGKVIELWYEPHFSIRAIWPTDRSQYIADYEIERDGQWISCRSLGLGREMSGQWMPDIIHFRRGVDPHNPRYGLSPLGAVLRELVTDNEAAAYSALLMKNCGVPPILIRPKETAKGLNEPQMKEIEEKLAKKLRGDNRGKPVMISNAVDLDLLSFDNEKLDLSGVRSIPETRVASAIGIPGQVLGFKEHLHKNTFSNYAEAREAAYEGYVIPTQRVITGTLKSGLLDDLDGTSKPDRKVFFDLSQVRILQDDENKKAERVARLFESGVWKRSESRAATNQTVTPEDEVYISDIKASAAGQFVDALANDDVEE